MNNGSQAHKNKQMGIEEANGHKEAWKERSSKLMDNM